MKVCEVPGCDKPVKARGLCGTHYSQLRRTGSATGSMKTRDPAGFIPQQPKERCSVEGCENPYMAGGYCNMHYLRNQKYGTPEPEHILTFEEKRLKGLCSKCGFNPRRDNNSWCQPCLNEKSREWNASEAGPRWRRYKLKKQDIIEMKVAQRNACAICGDSFDNVEDHVDHDNRCCGKEKVHNGGTCGECVRALLCGSCNQGLGNFKDSIERLLQAVDYLRKWE